MELATVYYKPGCPFGIRLRLSLLLHGVPFRPVRFRDDEEGASRVREVAHGCEISPTVHVNGRWLTHPHWSEVRQAVDEAGAGRSDALRP